MWPARSKTDNHITGFNIFAWQDGVAFHCTDSKTCQIIISICIHSRHLGCFPANQGASRLLAPLCNSCNHLRCNLYLQMTRGKIIEEKQWLGALNHKVIHAHGDKVNTDCIMDIAFNCNFEFCAHAIIRRDQHRIFVMTGS